MSKADQHIKRTSRAHGAKPASATVEPFRKRRVVADLHSATFVQRVGDDNDDDTLQAAHKAFNGLGHTLAQLYDREAVIRADASKTPEAHAMIVTEMADKFHTHPLPAVDSARQAAIQEIQRIDGEIEKTFRSQLSEGERQEIRGYVRGLTGAKRREFLSKADEDTLAAVLSGKPFLSGMSQAEAEALRKGVVDRRFAAEMERRAKLERAAEHLADGGQAYMRHIQRLRDGRADEIRAAAAKADEALKAPMDGAA